MHFLAFRLKRAHQASLRISRQIASRYALTPARYDLLYMIWKSYFAPKQSKIRAALGVARSTVSRMLKSLEELGIVRRTKSDGDRRTRRVELTPEGRSQFLKLQYVVEFDEMQLAYEVAFGLSKGRNTFGPIDHFFWTAKTIAEQFGDTADLWFPTGHPDD